MHVFDLPAHTCVLLNIRNAARPCQRHPLRYECEKWTVFGLRCVPSISMQRIADLNASYFAHLTPKVSSKLTLFCTLSGTFIKYQATCILVKLSGLCYLRMHHNPKYLCIVADGSKASLYRKSGAECSRFPIQRSLRAICHKGNIHNNRNNHIISIFP